MRHWLKGLGGACLFLLMACAPTTTPTNGQPPVVTQPTQAQIQQGLSDLSLLTTSLKGVLPTIAAIKGVDPTVVAKITTAVNDVSTVSSSASSTGLSASMVTQIENDINAATQAAAQVLPQGSTEQEIFTAAAALEPVLEIAVGMVQNANPPTVSSPTTPPVAAAVAPTMSPAQARAFLQAHPHG